MSFLLPVAKPRPSLVGRFGRLAYWLVPVALLVLLFVTREMEAPPFLEDTSALVAVAPQYPGQRPNEWGGYVMSDEAKHQVALERASHVNRGIAGEVYLTLAGIVYLCGRGARYLFAGE